MELNDIIGKLKNILDKIREKKNVSLFVIIQREDSMVWDLIVGGRNLDNKENLEWIIKIINKELFENERILFSRLLLLNSDSPFVSSFNKSFSVVVGGPIRIQKSKINNISINDAYLFYSAVSNQNK